MRRFFRDLRVLLRGDAALLSRRDCTIVAWHAVPGRSARIDSPRRGRMIGLLQAFFSIGVNTVSQGIRRIGGFGIKMFSPHPTGRINIDSLSRHCVPGYDQIVPPGHVCGFHAESRRSSCEHRPVFGPNLTSIN
jgi:hypothetical protein